MWAALWSSWGLKMFLENSIWKRSNIWLAYLLIYLIMCFFCSHSPLTADDFCQMVNPFDAKTALYRQWRQYIGINSRFPSHLFNSVILLRAEWVHCFLTPLVFTGLIFVIQILIWGKDWKQCVRWYYPLCTFAALWIFTPAFGQAFFWRTGSSDYCYTTFISMVYLIPFRLLLDDTDWRPRKPLLLLLLVLSFFAGWSNENLGITNVLGSGIFLFYLYKKERKIFGWAIALVGICLIGWLVLIFSPGNYGRLNLPAFANYRNLSLYMKLTNFLTYLFNNEIHFLLLSCIASLGFLYCIFRRNYGIQFFTAAVYYVLFQLSMCAFLFSPLPAYRALTASTVFLCISSISFLSLFKISIIRKSIAGILILYCAYSVTQNSILFLKQYEIVTQRKEAIRGSAEPVFDKYYESSGKYFFPNSLKDIDAGWVGNCLRSQYKLKKITLR